MQSDFFADLILYLQLHWDNLFPYVMVVVWLAITGLIYVIATTLAKRSLKSIGMGIEAASGVVLILRLLFFIVAVTIVVNAFETSLATILSLGAIFGTALGLAFSQALGNIVSGLYVVAARPFRVGDYVRIGNVEGVVKEITLNYTRVLLSDKTHQLVPNNKVVGSEVTNYRIEDLPGLIEDKEEERVDAVEERRSRRYIRSMDSAIHKLKELATDEDYYRYTFDLTLHMSFDHSKLMAHFDKVCLKWSTIFLAQPSYIIWAKPNAAMTYRFTIIVADAMTIINQNSEFMKELLKHWIEMEGK